LPDVHCARNNYHAAIVSNSHIGTFKWAGSSNLRIHRQADAPQMAIGASQGVLRFEAVVVQLPQSRIQREWKIAAVEAHLAINRRNSGVVWECFGWQKVATPQVG
jgi:hypothetical protein